MVHKRIVPLNPVSRAALIIILIAGSLPLVVWPSAMALAQDRAPVQGPSPSPAREKETEFARAARVAADRLAAAFRRVEGMIIGFEGDQVLIDRGAVHGVFQGMELEVFREGEDFKHPLTSEVLGRLDKELGMIRVLQVREQYSVSIITRRAEKAEFRQGDQVRVSMARMIVAFPNCDTEEVKGASARLVTKELAAALVRTGRFELIEDRQLRTMLLADKNLGAAELADPRILKQLADKGKAQALLLARLSPTVDGASLDVQVFSTLTGNPLILASAEVKPAAVAHDRLLSTSRHVPPSRSTEPFGPSADLRTSGVSESERPSDRTSETSLRASSPSEPFRLGPEFDRPMQAVAVGDLEGDGKQEMLLAAPDRLMIYRIDGRRLHLVGERGLNAKETVAVLEAADLTGDGRSEVIVSLSQKGRFHSLVLQWRDRQLAPIWEAPDLVLRVLSPDGKMFQLFGQDAEPAVSTVERQKGRAPGPIRSFSWDGRTFSPGQILDAPAGFSLLGLGLADLGGGEMQFLTLKQGGVLEVHSPTGGLVATHRDGGRLATVKDGVPRRILIEGGRNGERPKIILGLEEATGFRMLRWLTRRKAASLTALRWNGAGFEQAWQTPPSEGSLADYSVVDLEGGLGRHLLLLLVRQSRLGFGGGSEIQAFRLR